MLEYLLQFEREWFLTINSFHTPFLDSAMMMYTGFIAWIPFILFFAIWLVYNKPRKEWLPLLAALVVVVVLGNLIAEFMFKPFFERLRPTFHPDFAGVVKTVKGYTGGGSYGFISGHSTFSFSVALFTSLVFRYKPYTIVVFLWAALMVYSRLYLGVHFITDVIPGILVGLLVGWGIYRLYVSRQGHLVGEGSYGYLQAIYSIPRKKLLVLALGVNILLIFLLATFIS